MGNFNFIETWQEIINFKAEIKLTCQMQVY